MFKKAVGSINNSNATPSSALGLACSVVGGIARSGTSVVGGTGSGTTGVQTTSAVLAFSVAVGVTRDFASVVGGTFGGTTGGQTTPAVLLEGK